MESQKKFFVKMNEKNRLLKQREERPKKARKQQERLTRAARKRLTTKQQERQTEASKKADENSEKLPRRMTKTTESFQDGRRKAFEMADNNSENTANKIARSLTADKNSEKTTNKIARSFYDGRQKQQEASSKCRQHKSDKLHKRPSKTARITTEETTRTKATSRLLNTVVYLAYRKFSVESTFAVRQKYGSMRAYF